MRALVALWKDESGLVLSAEAVTLGTLGVVGATVGLSAAARSLNSELEETAFALRSLDQSFSISGQECCGAMTAGSSYTQMSVKEAHAELRKQIERDRRELGESSEGREDGDDRDDDRKVEKKKSEMKSGKPKRKRQEDRDDDEARGPVIENGDSLDPSA